MTFSARLSVVAAMAALLLAPSVPAAAQYVVPGAPIYGSFSVTLGDYAPGSLSGMAGGPVSLGQVDGSCRGYASVQPSHVLTVGGPTTVRIAVSSGQDSTLMVMFPDGRRLCNDDSNGLDAMIESATGPGPVYVWVGSYSGTNFPYQLTVTQSAPVAPPSYGPGGIPLDCGMTRAVYGSLRVGDPIMLGAHSPWSGPNGQGGYVSGDTNWADEMRRFVGAQTVITSFEGLDSAGCAVVRVAVDGGQYYWRIRDARPVYGAPPPPPPPVVVAPPPPVVVAPPPPVVVAPPSVAMRVTLEPRVPVTLFAPGITTPTVAVWTPRGGAPVEFAVMPAGGLVTISASVGGVAQRLFEVPASLASTAVITATRRPDGKVLFRAERAPEGVDPGQQMLLLVDWSRASGAPQIMQQWIGTFSESAPRWSR